MAKRARVWVRRIVFVCLIPVLLVLLVSMLLYIPAIQNFVVRKAAGYASESLGMDIGFEKMRLAFPLDLSIHNV